jgi:colanic acid/amylovoran biosynthesis glycosyltransferase
MVRSPRGGESLSGSSRGRAQQPSARPSVALFCATFLKPEMLHIHRQISGLQSFSPVIIAQKLEGDWPADRIEVVRRSRSRFLGRASEKRSGRPWQISNAEASRIFAVIEHKNCLLLHVFFGNVAIHLLPLLRRCSVPVVVSFHGSDVAGSMASAGYSEALAELFALATIVPCRSKQLASRVASLGCPETKTRLMRTSVPDLRFVQREPPGNNAWRIVQAARLVRKKGVSAALHAFAAFGRRHPEATFTIAGQGPLEEALRRTAAALGVSDRVRFAGFLPQRALQDLFFESHVFLHPSETAGGDVEGVPNSMLEAMASGLPVVSTRHGGIPEAIEDGKNGLLCEEGDVEGVTSALLRLAADPSLYRTLSRQASDSVREQFSKERQVAAIEEIYNHVILEHSHQSPATA